MSEHLVLVMSLMNLPVSPHWVSVCFLLCWSSRGGNTCTRRRHTFSSTAVIFHLVNFSTPRANTQMCTFSNHHFNMNVCIKKMTLRHRHFVFRWRIVSLHIRDDANPKAVREHPVRLGLCRAVPLVAQVWAKPSNMQDFFWLLQLFSRAGSWQYLQITFNCSVNII